MTPGMLRQVIRTSQRDRRIREFDEKVALVFASWLAGMVSGLILIKLMWG